MAGRPGQGWVILGINPGRGSNSNDPERDRYKRGPVAYQTHLDYWNENIGTSHRYHIASRNFLSRVGLSGPILWTELVKCENDERRDQFPARNA
jgi:hypothetical protein